jgi:hypothetical protein
MLLRELAGVVSRARRLEFEGFAVLGARPIGDDVALAVFFAGASRAHGFRAAMLESCLPVASGYVEQDVARSGLAINEVVAAMCAQEADREVFDALVGVFYPQLRDAYEVLRVEADGPGDTFCRRTFRRCRDDLDGILEEATAFRTADPRAARAQRVRALLDEYGGLAASLRGDEARRHAFDPGQAPGGTA